MEAAQTILPEEAKDQDNNLSKLMDKKEYELNIDKQKYKLIIEIFKNEIVFKVKKTNYIAFIYYTKTFTYDELSNQLNLKNNLVSEMFEIFEKKNIVLCKDKNYRNIIKIKIIRIVDSKEKVYSIDLEKEYNNSLFDAVEEIMEEKLKNNDIELVKKINEINDEYEINELENSLKKKYDKELEEKLKKLKTNKRLKEKSQNNIIK